MTAVANLTRAQSDANARNYIQASLAGKVSTIRPEECGPRWKPYIDDAKEVFDREIRQEQKGRAVWLWLCKLVYTAKHDELATLLNIPDRDTQDRNARICLQQFKPGQQPDIWPDCGVHEADLRMVKQGWNGLAERSKTDEMLRNILRNYSKLTELLNDQKELESGDQQQSSQDGNADQTVPLYAVPPLQAEAKKNEARAHEASPVLDAMIRFFRYWCTRSYEGYHTAVALWVLSVIAARRVYLPWRNGVWSSLYIMLVAKSTTHAKTEAAAYGRKILEECGLGFLLSADEITPQKLVNNMAGDVATLPRNYACLSPEKKEQVRLKVAFSAQQGWIYDEWGNKLQEIVHAKGSSAYLYPLLKQLYDCKRQYIYETISRAGDVLDMPSLSILGTATPACLKPIMGRESALFTDGFSARIAFEVPSADEVKLQSAPNEECVVPLEIIRSLQDWHDRLGEPTCEIVEKELIDALEGDEKKKKAKDGAPYEIVRGELPQNPVFMPQEVYKAHELYYASLATLIQEYKLDERFSSNYGRLPDMALRVAMLLASLENDGRMDMRHWGRGQQIAEHWRYNFHELIFQLESSAVDGYGALEQLVLDVLSEQKKIMSPRDISQKRIQLRAAGAPKIREICNELVSDKAIGKQGNGKEALYGLKELVQS